MIDIIDNLMNLGAFFGDTIWVILSVERSGTLALTQQMDKFHDLGTPNHMQSHNQAFIPNATQHTLSRASETGIQNGIDHAMNPFASPGMYPASHHGQNNALHTSTSCGMLPPANISPSPGVSANYQLQNTALSASPSSSFSNPHLLMRRPSSPTDSDQPVVSARNILARKISESPIDRNASNVMCNGDSTFISGAQHMNTNTSGNPSNGVMYENRYEDEEMD